MALELVLERQGDEVPFEVTPSSRIMSQQAYSMIELIGSEEMRAKRRYMGELYGRSIVTLPKKVEYFDSSRKYTAGMRGI